MPQGLTTPTGSAVTANTSRKKRNKSSSSAYLNAQSNLNTGYTPPKYSLRGQGVPVPVYPRYTGPNVDATDVRQPGRVPPNTPNPWRTQTPLQGSGMPALKAVREQVGLAGFQGGADVSGILSRMRSGALTPQELLQRMMSRDPYQNRLANYRGAEVPLASHYAANFQPGRFIGQRRVDPDGSVWVWDGIYWQVSK